MKDIGLVSIVVPVYNSDPYLKDCLESIVSQTYARLEIVLVNDGSSDKSPEIMNEFARKDRRIIVINQKNAGATAAREAGVKACGGSWILFSDGDDVMPCDAVEKLADAVEAGIQIVAAGLVFKGCYKWPYKPLSKTYSQKEYAKALVKKQIHCGPYCKLISKELFSDSVFKAPPHIVCGEDYIMNLCLAANIRGGGACETNS